MEQRRHGLMRNPDILVGNAFQAPTFTSAYKNSFDRFLNGRTFVTSVLKLCKLRTKRSEQ